MDPEEENFSLIYHLALPADWDAAQPVGYYSQSTRGLDLETVGFIHCSFAEQLAATANRFYADVAELLVLVIDRARFDDILVVEPGDPGRLDGEQFPHLYGPLPVDAVQHVERWSRDADGVYRR